MSVALAKPYGIEGVAFGTMVPLIVASVVIIVYTCRLLQLNIWDYVFQAYSGGAAGLLAALAVIFFIDVKAQTYLGIFFKSGLVTLPSWELPCL